MIFILTSKNTIINNSKGSTQTKVIIYTTIKITCWDNYMQLSHTDPILHIYIIFII